MATRPFASFILGGFECSTRARWTGPRTSCRSGPTRAGRS